SIKQPTKLAFGDFHRCCTLFGRPLKFPLFYSPVMKPETIIFPLRIFNLSLFRLQNTNKQGENGSREKHSFTMMAKPSIDLRRSVLPRAKYTCLGEMLFIITIEVHATL